MTRALSVMCRRLPKLYGQPQLLHHNPAFLGCSGRRRTSDQVRQMRIETEISPTSMLLFRKIDCGQCNVQPVTAVNNFHRSRISSLCSGARVLLRRSHSTNNNCNNNDNDDNNPFDVLGIPSSSSYEVVKRRFIDLALKLHPDVSASTSADAGVDGGDGGLTFVRLRKAFEAIRKNKEDGSAGLVPSSSTSDWSEEEFRAWFNEETGHADVMFRMDCATRKEVVDLIKTNQAQGGLDKGGMWEMAKTMALQEANFKATKGKEVRGSKGINSGETFTVQRKVRRRRRTK